MSVNARLGKGRGRVRYEIVSSPAYHAVYRVVTQVTGYKEDILYGKFPTYMWSLDQVIVALENKGFQVWTA